MPRQVDLLHPELYRVPENPLPIDPADAALLVDEDVAAAGGRGSAKARSVAALPWLMNTQYISNDLYTKSTAPGISEKRMKKIKAWMTSHPSEVQALSQQGLSGSGHGDVSVARQCDHCGATAEEAGLKQRLLVCSGCGAARYCSAQCQKAAWQGGHKKACGL